MDSADPQQADYAPAEPARGILGYVARHPVGFWFIFWGELAERCAFYGIRALLFVYLTTVLGFHDAYATQVSSTFKAACGSPSSCSSPGARSCWGWWRGSR